MGGNTGLARVQGISVTADANVQLYGAFKGNADTIPIRPRNSCSAAAPRSASMSPR